MTDKLVHQRKAAEAAGKKKKNKIKASPSGVDVSHKNLHKLEQQPKAGKSRSMARLSAFKPILTKEQKLANARNDCKSQLEKVLAKLTNLNKQVDSIGPQEFEKWEEEWQINVDEMRHVVEIFDQELEHVVEDYDE